MAHVRYCCDYYRKATTTADWATALFFIALECPLADSYQVLSPLPHSAAKRALRRCSLGPTTLTCLLMPADRRVAAAPLPRLPPRSVRGELGHHRARRL